MATTTTPSWKSGVDEHVMRCKVALQFFAGPEYQTAKTILNAFLALISQLESSTGSQSQIISSKSQEILGMISDYLRTVGNSPQGLLNGFYDELHPVFAFYRLEIGSFAGSLGNSSISEVNASTIDLEVSIFQLITDYRNGAPVHICDNNMDYAHILKSVQRLLNAVADIALTLDVKKNADVRDSYYILALILDHLVIIGHATIVSIAAELNMQCGLISDTLSQVLGVIDTLLGGITDALNAVVNTVSETVDSLLNAIVGLADSLNNTLNSLFDLLENAEETVSSTLLDATDGLSQLLYAGK